MYQGPGVVAPQTMHMITPGVAASLTPTSVERRTRPGGPQAVTAAARAPRRLHVPRVLLHLPHPHLPHRHA
jgi:hypothetical protein